MKMLKSQVLACLLLALLAGTAQAAGAPNVPPQKQTTLGLYLSATEAAERMTQAGAKTLFLDVRTREEVVFLGMPALADAHVPYLENPNWAAWDEKKRTFKLESNADFAAEVERRVTEKGLAKSDAIILMCRSGDRSARAANLLASLGYTQVYTVVDGYEGDLAKEGAHKGQRAVNGWKNAGLPWSYELDKRKMYKISEN